jgi:membrane-associated phospholipid phosphatase
VIIGLPITLGIAGLIKKDSVMFRQACFIAMANIINSGITYSLKYSIHRERPFVTYPDINKKSDGGGPSFPSGHTSAAFATATALSLAYPKWYVIVPSYLWAGAVGYSRMYLGVHYPTDVMAGMITGAGSAFLSYKLNKWLTLSYLKNIHKNYVTFSSFS